MRLSFNSLQIFFRVNRIVKIPNKNNRRTSSQLFWYSYPNMENVNVQNSTSSPVHVESTVNGTYAEVLSKGKPKDDCLSNNNALGALSTNENDLSSTTDTDNLLSEASELNISEASTFVTANSSPSDSSEPTDDSQIIMESTLGYPDDSSKTATEEDTSYLSQATEKADDESSIGLKEENTSQCSGNYSGSGEESDTEEEDSHDLDELYPSALKWKFRSLNPTFKLPETVTVLETKHGSKVFLVGTAHFSQESQEDVAKTVKLVQPDIVVLELCKSRVNILSMDEATIIEESKNMNFQKIKTAIEQNGLLQGALYLLLLSMSANITKQLGMAPGGEFRRAYTEAKQVPGCLVHLGDRPIHITMQRALSRLSLWRKIRIAWHMLQLKDPITKEEVERCKQKDLLEKMLADMTGEFPELSRVFVKERDIFLTYSLQMSAERFPLPTYQESVSTYVVGVVGIGHVSGIKELWGKVTEEDVKEILSIPEPTLTSIIIRKSIKVSFVGLGVYTLYKVLPSSLTKLLTTGVQKVINYTYNR